jgi:hypothetical protein
VVRGLDFATEVWYTDVQHVGVPTNNMFEEARNGNLLCSVHEMMYKMTERISFIRKKLQGKNGVVDKISSLVQKDG